MRPPEPRTPARWRRLPLQVALAAGLTSGATLARAQPPSKGYPQFPGDPEPVLDELPDDRDPPPHAKAPPDPGVDPSALDEAETGGETVLQAPPPPERAYALSVSMLGDARARATLLDLWTPSTPPPPLVDAPDVPDATVGVVLERGEAMRWLAGIVFAEAVGFHAGRAEIAAPAPGGAAYDLHHVVLAAVHVTEVDGEGHPTDTPWPSRREQLVPEGTSWRPASLISSHAPLFAAPAASIPAALEAHDRVRRAGDLFVLGELDRCADSATRCLRWLQVVARDGDRFTAGYLPAFMVSTDEAWVRAPGGLPRAQLQPSAVVDGRATYMLVARGLDGRLRRRTITAPAEDGGFAPASVQIEGPDAVVTVAGIPTLRLSIDADLDHLDAPTEDLLTTP